MGLGWRVQVQWQPAFCPSVVKQEQQNNFTLWWMDAFLSVLLPGHITRETHHGRQRHGIRVIDTCAVNWIDVPTYFGLKNTTINTHYSEYPVVMHTYWRQAVLSRFCHPKKWQKSLCVQEGNLCTPNKDMFGEQLKKSAVTGNYIWAVHMRADTTWFPATGKYWEGWGSRMQGSNADLRPVPGCLQPFTAFVAWQLIITLPGTSL